MARILVVDDDEMFLKIYDGLLGDAGYDVAQAKSGQAALTASKETPPDLILMDLNMPKMNGFQAIRKLREESETAKTPIIAITGEESEHVYEEIYDAGADGYLGKPLDIERLLTRIREILPS